MIHNIIPRKERLAAIHLADTDRCTVCGKRDSLSHRITEWGEGPIIWNWTRARITTMLRTDPCHIPAEWKIRRTYHFWPPQKYAAFVWIIAHIWWRRGCKHRNSPSSAKQFPVKSKLESVQSNIKMRYKRQPTEHPIKAFPNANRPQTATQSDITLYDDRQKGDNNHLTPRQQQWTVMHIKFTYVTVLDKNFEILILVKSGRDRSVTTAKVSSTNQLEPGSDLIRSFYF